MNIRKTPEFDEWLSSQNRHSRGHIEDRLDRIREHNHFGDRKYLGAELHELRWKNGRRVYYAVAVDNDGKIAIMLLGGNKNGQNQDIAQARRLLEREE
ncbi:MAG: type II toxin-antitoxin system RelE/ParE family toxin [Elusimicrobia bacterium]|nr:type II toxin-antitoxin system RelE/ParE family toxin [Elusimicrobiota bacterium]MDE2511075.1 type II toxin-antitoxin system RelE/ParE family toxin [Elusimicrobiota bacterium]